MYAFGHSTIWILVNLKTFEIVLLTHLGASVPIFNISQSPSVSQKCFWKSEFQKVQTHPFHYQTSPAIVWIIVRSELMRVYCILFYLSWPLDVSLIIQNKNKIAHVGSKIWTYFKQITWPVLRQVIIFILPQLLLWNYVTNSWHLCCVWLKS